MRLISYARARRIQILLATLFSVLNKTLDLAPPVLIGAAIDVVVQREDSLLADLGIVAVEHQLWVLGAITVVIWGLESLFEYLLGVAWRTLAQQVQHDVRLDAFARVHELELRYFEDRSTGGLLAVLSDDVNQLERFLDGGANDLIQVLTTALLVGGAFFAFSPTLAFFAMLPVPFVIWGSLAFQKRVAPRYQDVRERVSDLNAQLTSSLGGVATVRSFTGEPFEIERIRQASEAYQASNQRAIRLSSAFSPLIRMLIVIGFTTTLVYGGHLVLDGALAASSYAVLVFLTQRLLWPLTRLGVMLDLYQRAMASTRRILDLVDTEPEIVSGDVPLDRGAVRGDITFDAVSFAYRPDQPILRDLTLHFPAGSTTAIVGATGSGKTSLIKLLLRFYESDTTGTRYRGTIRLDDHPIETLRLDDLRHAIALVSQDVFLFPGTVHDNIAYGVVGAGASTNVSRDNVIAAARAAEAHDFIDALPDGYDTRVGERGVRLSGGQRQRLSMARAILKDAPILVLDEATSAVDNETEAAIQHSLQRVAEERTTIVIAHRLSTIRRADRIDVLDHGRLAESGTHDELVARDGLYAALWRVQTGAHESRPSELAAEP